MAILKVKNVVPIPGGAAVKSVLRLLLDKSKAPNRAYPNVVHHNLVEANGPQGGLDHICKSLRGGN
ncbi:MAG: hypothetical protein BJ554DRAFT_5955 [Olpidium bornovanus]|uniref:Uncharacterized protein n=1 Tax=Olpidium bornovanus TaxID=278681 RepID=A0A8H8DKK7_9FUNG|nr:MAG: hypothetical protein BJ554DRAFT_5955 [Olpidium bornovanus]